MKKKIIICLVLLISICFVTSCNNKKEDNTTTTTTTKEAEGNIAIGDEKVSLSEDGFFEKMTFKYVKNSIVNSLGTYTILVYQKKGTDQELFRIGITKFYGKPETVMGDTATKVGTKKVNDIEWEIYQGDNKMNTYAYYYDYDTYTISFMSNEDTTKLEEEFMKTVKFN